MSLNVGTFHDRPLNEEERDRLIESMARAVVAKRMETMAVFLIDAHRPFSFMASQALLVTAPVLGAFFGFRRVDSWSRILEDRANLERLMSRIEELVTQRDAVADTDRGEAAA